MSLRSMVKSTAVHVLLVFVAAVSIAPIALVWLTSLKSSAELSVNPLGVPQHWLFSNFSAAWSTAHLGQYTANSVIVAVPSVLITVAAAGAAGYALALFPFWGRGLLIALFLFGLSVPNISIVASLFYTERSLALVNTRPGLIMAEIAQALPLAVLIMRATFRDLPRELREAALVDGGTEFTVLARVYMPLARPALVAVGVLTFLTVWNDYLYPLVLINSDALRTIPLGLAYLNSTYVENVVLVAAATALGALPSIVIYVILQRQFIRGVTDGALK
jgi:ABC-type glycerol-3-phosphate transport system permease component